MTFRRYVYLVMLPNLIYCSIIGKPAMFIEKVARRVRMHCGNRMQQVMEQAPENGQCNG
ncbi:hypothetical protein [Citrobacter freundii]|uniref:hypothetical protein n=1 Tax=Citrobacter freundii TaxID=546 RepID=UPI002FE5EE03